MTCRLSQGELLLQQPVLKDAVMSVHAHLAIVASLINRTNSANMSIVVTTQMQLLFI